LTFAGSTAELRRQSTNVRQRPAMSSPVVTQLVTQPRRRRAGLCAVATRYDKLTVRCLATVRIAAIGEWL
jgi:hypothetical protein